MPLSNFLPLLLLASVAGQPQPRLPAVTQAAAAPAIPHRTLKLENGLTVVLQRDPSAPEVGVELWMRGGSREEGEGQLGLAHLFEHSVTASGPFFTNAENRANRARVSRNGGAGAQFDYLNFYLQVAPEGLEVALAQLGDRAAGDKSKFTASRLKTDQDIVISELKRSAGGPYDPEVTGRLLRGTFGKDHPYGHSTGGLEADVLATKVDVLEAWHRKYAGAASSILFIVGNFDERLAEQLVRKHFGPLAPGTLLPTARQWVPEPRAIREQMENSIPTGTVYRRWPTPGWGEADADRLILAARILSERLERRLAGTPVTSARAAVEQWEMAGEFTLSGSFSDSGSAPTVEAMLNRELASLIKDGPTAAELARAKLQWRTEFVRRLENPVWRGGRSEVLGFGLLFKGDSNFYQSQVGRIASATPAEIGAAARKWLQPVGYTLHLLPAAVRRPGEAIDRTATAGLLPSLPTSYPAARETKLSNGLKLIIAEQPRLPLARVTLAFAAGSGSDEAGRFGRARAVLNALPQAMAGGRPLKDALAELGADIALGLDGEYASLSYTILAEQLEASLRLMSQALLAGPSAQAMEASRKKSLEQVRSAAASPLQARARAAACALRTPCNPGAVDHLGSVAGLEALSAEQAHAFYATHYRPSNATLIISGQVPAGAEATVRTLLNRGGPPPTPLPVHGAGLATGGGVILIDRPGATQSTLFAVQNVAKPLISNPLKAKLAVLALRTRLMDNLRTEKGWSYEIFPFGMAVGREAGIVHFNAPLQPDKTGKAIREIEREMKRLRDEDLPPEALEAAKSYLLGSEISPGMASLTMLNSQLLELERLALPASYFANYPSQLAAMKAADLRETANALLDPAAVTWVIAGDVKVLKPVLDAENIRYTIRSAVD